MAAWFRLRWLRAGNDRRRPGTYPVARPRLNYAATIVAAVRGVHSCFARDFPRRRTVLINSDDGSTDGTPDLMRNASFTEADMVQTSHSLLRVLVIAIGVVMALEQLGLATAVVRTAFAITFGALMLGLAIAAPHF